MKPLHGLQIVITRPQTQALKWQQQLHDLGATTYCVPVMDISPLSEAPQLEKIQSFAKNISAYQKIIFISQNAVAFARQAFDQLPKLIGSSTKIYAIGSATAQGLRDWGLEVEAADAAMNSETLLQLPSLQAIQSEHIAICRGVGGRETLAKRLQERGATVDYIELYQRQPHSEAKSHLAKLPWTVDNARNNTVLSAHSGDSVQWLSDLLQSAKKIDIMKTWPLLVPGERVEKIAKHCGFFQVIVAKNASDDEMSLTLQSWWKKV